jgi:hypothetical protein
MGRYPDLFNHLLGGAAMDYSELVGRIKAAFADVSEPAQDNIVCHDCEECSALRESVIGRTPDELSDTWVQQNFDQLPFFSDEAKRFYLPAFLRVAALKPDSEVAQYVLYSLSDEFRMHPSGGYSPQQSQAIRDFLSFVEPRVDEYDREYVAKAIPLWQGGT